jgi:hypothetical protein
MSKDTKDNTFLLGSEWWLGVPDRTWGKRPPTLPMRRGNLGSGVWESWLVTHWSCPLSKNNKISPTYPTSIGFPSVLGNFPFAKPMPDWGLTREQPISWSACPLDKRAFNSRGTAHFSTKGLPSQSSAGENVDPTSWSSQVIFLPNYALDNMYIRLAEPLRPPEIKTATNSGRWQHIWQPWHPLEKIVDMGALGVPSLQMSWDVEDLWWFSMTCP